MDPIGPTGLQMWNMSDNINTYIKTNELKKTYTCIKTTDLTKN
jgi:hypothetical protein